MKPLTLHTPRLRLIAASLKTLRAERAGRAELAQALGLHVPDDWPPPLFNESTNRWKEKTIRQSGVEGRWLHWFIAGSEQADDAVGTLIGIAGFHGIPKEGMIEVGYAVIPHYQKRGFATEAVGALIEFVMQRQDVNCVIAHTFEDLYPSIRVLEKLGFEQTEMPEAIEPATGKRLIRFKKERAP